MDEFKRVLMVHFDIDLDEMSENFIKGFFTQGEVWDIRQCDVCGHTIITPYNSILKYHVSEKHFIPGNYVSILEENKPVTLKDAFENFRIHGFYNLSEKSFLDLKNFLLGKKIIDKTK